VINETFRPGDDAYWVQTWSRVLFAGDLFAAIPFLDQPAVESIDDDGGGKHYLGPIVYGYGLLVSPTCDMIDQATLEISHPYRVFVPVIPLAELATHAPGQARNLGLIANRDTVIPYMYLPPLPNLFPASVALLFRPSLLDEASLRATPRRVAQLGPAARQQLKIKLIRYWSRFDPDREGVRGTERDEDAMALQPGETSPYDLVSSPEDLPELA